MSKKEIALPSVLRRAQDAVLDIAVQALRPIVRPLVQMSGKFKLPKKKPAAPAKVVKKKARTEEAKRPFLIRFALQERILLAKRLSMILRSGLPIMEGLHILKEETKSRSATFIYHSLITDVSSGQTLSTGLQKFERHFGTFAVNIIRVGEASGTLHENLEYLADELKKKQTLRRKVVSALVYPAVIVFATVGITVMLTVYIFPKLLPIFAGLNATLPITTRALIAISAFLGAWGWWLLVGIVLFGIGFYILMRRIPLFHYGADICLMRIPLFGTLSRSYNLANTCRTTAVLLKSAVPVVQALELVAASTKNLAYRKALTGAREGILKGQRLSVQLKENPRLFPSLMTQMIAVGETTGNLVGTLHYLSDMYEEEIGDLTKNLTTLLEPALMVVMGLIVGFIAVSIITPIYSITQSLNPPR